MSECRVVDLKELGVSKEVFEKIYSMGEEDGREDAFDEFIEWLNKYHNYGKSVIDIYVEEYKEYLKEQKE